MSSRKKRRLFSVLLAGIMTMSVAANALPVGAEVQESNGPVIDILPIVKRIAQERL